MTEAPLSVLFVDDEAAVLRALERSLKRSPYRVLSASSGPQALEVLRREHVDILVSDVDMPEMSGLELVELTRRAHPEVVRILLTGQASFNNVVQAINGGAISKYLAKPCDVELLADTLAEVAAQLRHTRRGASDVEAEAIARFERAFPGIAEVPRGSDGVAEVPALGELPALLGPLIG